VKVLLINGSPRRAAASSRLVLDSLKAKLGPECEYRMIEIAAQAEARPEDLEADLLVLAFPLLFSPGFSPARNCARRPLAPGGPFDHRR